MEERKQTYIAAWALVVSIISLAVTVIIAINQYKEKIEVVAEKVYIESSNIDDGYIDCRIELIVANTSNNTVSLVKSDIYRSYPGFRASEEIEVSMQPGLPLTLIHGGAERVTMCCKYYLSEEDKNAVQNGTDLSHILQGKWLSVRIYSAKGKCYSIPARLNTAVQK